MRHLKKFNEDDRIGGLKEFCNSSLAYLIDEGYSIDYDTSFLKFGGNIIYIKLSKKVNTGRHPTQPFNWIDVKYDYISFLESLSKKYEIKGGTTISNPEYVEVLFDMRNIVSKIIVRPQDKIEIFDLPTDFI